MVDARLSVRQTFCDLQFLSREDFSTNIQLTYHLWKISLALLRRLQK